MTLPTDRALQITVWRKPDGSPDAEYERLGDFPDVSDSLAYVLSECHEPGWVYLHVPAFCAPEYAMRTPLPSEEGFLNKYHSVRPN